MLKKSTLLATTALAFALSPATVAAQDAQAIAELERQIQILRQQVESLRNTVTTTTAPEAEEAEAGDPIQVKWEPAPSISSPDGRFEMNLRGRLLVDTAWVNDANDNENTSATEFRAARIGIEGKAWSDVKYKFEADFSGNDVDVKDAYLQWSGPAKFTFGQFKTPNSLEEQTSSRYITFMERASFTDAFSFGRQIGLGVTKAGDDYTFNAGIFRGANGVSDEDEGYALATRLTYGPKMDDMQMHFGGSLRYRNNGEDQGDFRYRQRPHSHLAGNRYVQTSRFADSDTFYGFEAAAVMGPLSVQGEWGFLSANISTPAAGETNPTFSGGYIELSYFLTGESRKYDPKKGSFQRINVNDPVFSGGKGAFQVAARYDRIDLSDKTFFGGEQNTLVIGANWWLNRHTRFMVNYSNSKIKNGADVALNDANGENSVNTFGIRAQIDW